MPSHTHIAMAWYTQPVHLMLYTIQMGCDSGANICVRMCASVDRTKEITFPTQRECYSYQHDALLHSSWFSCTVTDICLSTQCAMSKHTLWWNVFVFTYFTSSGSIWCRWQTQLNTSGCWMIFRDAEFRKIFQNSKFDIVNDDRRCYHLSDTMLSSHAANWINWMPNEIYPAVVCHPLAFTYLDNLLLYLLLLWLLSTLWKRYHHRALLRITCGTCLW